MSAAELSLDFRMMSPAATSVVGDHVLSVEHLSVSFDGFKAVDDLSLNIEPNELRVIIGPNGAGKTTLLDMICGKTKPTAGHIYFKGTDLTTLAEHEIVREGIGRKFQTPSTYEDLSVLENLEVSLPIGHGVLGSIFFKRTAAIRERIEQIAGDVYLSDQLRTKAGKLSHGQQQWLEIGMLLAQNSELLLLDEPVAGMSPRERELTAALLKKISAGKSLIVIEHDMDFVKSIANKVTVLHQGKVLAEGNVEAMQNDERVIDVYLGH